MSHKKTCFIKFFLSISHLMGINFTIHVLTPHYRCGIIGLETTECFYGQLEHELWMRCAVTLVFNQTLPTPYIHYKLGYPERCHNHSFIGQIGPILSTKTKFQFGPKQNIKLPSTTTHPPPKLLRQFQASQKCEIVCEH